MFNVPSVFNSQTNELLYETIEVEISLLEKKTKTNIIAESIYFKLQKIQKKYIFLSSIFISKKYNAWLFLNEN